jgi:hypothetical protein
MAGYEKLAFQRGPVLESQRDPRDHRRAAEDRLLCYFRTNIEDDLVCAYTELALASADNRMKVAAILQ